MVFYEIFILLYGEIYQLTTDFGPSQKQKYSIIILCSGNILWHPHFIFTLFTLCPEGKFKYGLIKLFLKDYVGKFESERIQDLSNQF